MITTLYTQYAPYPLKKDLFVILPKGGEGRWTFDDFPDYLHMLNFWDKVLVSKLDAKVAFIITLLNRCSLSVEAGKDLSLWFSAWVLWAQERQRVEFWEGERKSNSRSQIVCLLLCRKLFAPQANFYGRCCFSLFGFVLTVVWSLTLYNVLKSSFKFSTSFDPDNHPVR